MNNASISVFYFSEMVIFRANGLTHEWIQRGGEQGVRTKPPGKSLVIWVSLGNKQLDHLKKLEPLLKNVEPPLESWKLIEKRYQSFLLSDRPGPPSPPPPPTKIPGSAHVTAA